MRALRTSLAIVLASGLSLIVGDVGAAHAQDDWSLSREPSGRGGGRRGSGRGASGRGASGRGASGRGASGRGASGRGASGRARAGGDTSAGTSAATTGASDSATPEDERASASPSRADVLIERYTRIVEADPRESGAYRRLVELYRERDGNLDGLVQALEARRDADPEVFAPRVLLGHVYRAQNRTDEARAAYRSAIAARPAD
ncbi:MAG: tetratricopeptide repeat protein, partial [Sandaracinaceae bacterium]